MAKRSGLTVLELLVALVSVAIVLAVLLHGLRVWFMNAHTAARQPTCMSNLKQIGLATLQYAQDYDDKFPNSGFAAVKIQGSPSAALTSRAEKPADAWHTELDPYIKNRQVYYCPCDEAPHKTNYAASALPGEYADSYTMNKWAVFGLKTESVTHLPEFILFAERNNEIQAGRGSYLFAPWKWDKDADAPQMAQDLALTRHSEGSNVGMADGHSKWHKPTQMIKLWESSAFQP